MKPLVTFPDAQAETLAILRAAASGAYSDRYADAFALLDGVTFGTKPYDVNADPAWPVPYVAVGLDATSGRYPVVQTSSLRVSVWGASDAKGLALAKKCHAILLSYMGGEAVRSFGELTGPVPTTDPDSRGPLSYFTVAARLRPVAL